MFRNQSKCLAVILALSMLLTACAGVSSNLPPTLTSTVRPTLTFVPTVTNQPAATYTASPIPTPTATPIPLPKKEDIDNHFTQEVEPLVKKLLSAGEDFSLELPEDYEVVYVPQTVRLNYVQTLLQLMSSQPESGKERVYVLYDYSRGATLGYKVSFSQAVSSETQEVTATIRLLVAKDGQYRLIEKEENTGTEGSTNPRNVVENAVLPLTKFGLASSVVETTLETLIGYGCGIDMNLALDYERKLALYAFAFSSDNWGDRRQALENFGELDPIPLDYVPQLIAFLGDQGAGIGSEAEKILTQLINSPDVLRQVKEAASDANEDIRASVADVLASVPHEAFSTLLTLSCDKDDYVRQKAISAIGNSESPNLFSQLTEALQNGDSCSRQAVINILDQRVDESDKVIPILLPILEDEDFEVRKASALTLCHMESKDKKALPVLIEAIKKEDQTYLFEQEASCIADLSSKEETLPLLEAVVGAESELRNTALTVLETYPGVPGAADFLISLLQSQEYFIRGRAAELLLKYGTEAEPARAILMEKASTEVDGSAFESEIQLLISLSDKETVLPILKTALSNPKYEVRRKSCSILGTFEGVPGAIETLYLALDDQDAYVASIAAGSLAKIAGDSKEQVLAELTKAARTTKISSAFVSEIEAIAALSSKEDTLPLLKEAIISPTIIIRYEACNILGTYKGVDGAKEIVSIALKDGQASIRQAAEKALAKLNEGN